MIRVIALFIVSALFSGCTTIAGKDTPSSPEEFPPLQLVFVETLRNEASLRGESFRETAYATDPLNTLQRPNSVFADPFRVYAVDRYVSSTITGARIFIFDRGNRTVTILDDSTAVKLVAPQSIVVSAAQVIFVSDSQQGTVFGYDINGVLLSTLGKRGQLGRPSGLALDPVKNWLYVADSAARNVKVYDSSRHRLFVNERRIVPPKGFTYPTALALDRRRNLYVLDRGSRRISVFDPDGNFLRDFGMPTDMPGVPPQPRGIAVDSGGHVYVTDRVNNNIMIFSGDGAFLHTWGRTGSLTGDFWTPGGIFIDKQDYVYIADQTNGRIQVFQYVP